MFSTNLSECSFAPNWIVFRLEDGGKAAIVLDERAVPLDWGELGRWVDKEGIDSWAPFISPTSLVIG